MDKDRLKRARFLTLAISHDMGTLEKLTDATPFTESSIRLHIRNNAIEVAAIMEDLEREAINNERKVNN